VVAALREPIDSAHTPEQALLALRDDADPFALIGRWAGARAILGSEPVRRARAGADPFALLDDQPATAAASGCAVGGGWFGYLGYGLGGLVEQLPPAPPRPVPLPPAALAFYDHVLVLDRDGRWWFEALARDERVERRLELLRGRLGGLAPDARPFRCAPFVPRPARAGHADAVRACKRYIAAGDLYQANLCIRLESAIEGALIDLFARASAELRPPYSAFLAGSWGAVASLSPELFLQRRGRTVVTRPIKGTARRDDDGGSREALARSAKDRAENVMIVDLMRNDLGRSCRIGSVEVTEIAAPEAHPGVWHLVSEVRGALPDGVGDGALVRGAFPPGSVTGAPKIKSMEVIAQLESTGREAYTGAIGFASPLAGLELNVAIRTLEARGGRIWLGAGGGIVAESDPEAEYREALNKAGPILAAAGCRVEEPAAAARAAAPGPPTRAPRPDPALGIFETVLVQGGEALELDAHLARLARSAELLYGAELPDWLADRAASAAAGAPDPARLRIRLVPGAAPVLEVEPVDPRAVLPERPVELVPLVLPGGLGEHKWSDRRILAQPRGGGEALIVDIGGEALETGSGALIAIEGDRLVVPPEDGRILPSVTRAAVLGLGFDLAVEPLTPARLRAADDVIVVSAIRRLQRADFAPRPSPVTVALAERWSSTVAAHR
jgi:para-aminobenzoate synthetase/4-amino-4-deoxychorismate lyase